MLSAEAASAVLAYRMSAHRAKFCLLCTRMRRSGFAVKLILILILILILRLPLRLSLILLLIKIILRIKGIVSLLRRFDGTLKLILQFFVDIHSILNKKDKHHYALEKNSCNYRSEDNKKNSYISSIHKHPHKYNRISSQSGIPFLQFFQTRIS